MRQDAPPPVGVKVPGGHRVHPAPNVPAVHCALATCTSPSINTATGTAKQRLRWVPMLLRVARVGA